MPPHPAVVEALQRALVRKRWVRRELSHAYGMTPHLRRLLAALADDHIHALEATLHSLHSTEVSHAQIYPLPG